MPSIQVMIARRRSLRVLHRSRLLTFFCRSAKNDSMAAVVASSGYVYDDAGRTTSVARTGPGGGDANYSYTTAGRLSGVAWSTGMEVAYSYNSVGELTEVAPSGTGSLPTVEFGYDPSGRVRSVVRHGETSSVSTDAE